MKMNETFRTQSASPDNRPMASNVSVLDGGVRIRTSKQSVFDMARTISSEDGSLRSRLFGKPVEMIRREAARAFARHGVALNGITLDDYARSVASGKDYRFVVAF